MGNKIDKFQVIDSHTGGEPTRVVIDKIPGLGSGNMRELRDEFALKCDWLRASLLSEPRGFEAMVGALLLDSEEPDCEVGVIFFNNKGVLKGCLHGTMGLVKTLEFMGRITHGVHSIETPVGIVKAELLQDGSVKVANVPSHRYLSDVEIELQDYGVIRGDIAWGGNWFYLIEGFGPEVNYSNIAELSSFSVDVMNELERSGITGEDGSNTDEEVTYAKFVLGGATIAYSKMDVEVSSSTNDREITQYGASFAVNENLSVSYGKAVVDFDNSATDQESSGASISYTMGSITAAAASNKETGTGGTSGSEDKMTEVTVSFAF